MPFGGSRMRAIVTGLLFVFICATAGFTVQTNAMVSDLRYIYAGMRDKYLNAALKIRTAENLKQADMAVGEVFDYYPVFLAELRGIGEDYGEDWRSRVGAMVYEALSGDIADYNAAVTQYAEALQECVKKYPGYLPQGVFIGALEIRKPHDQVYTNASAQFKSMYKTTTQELEKCLSELKKSKTAAETADAISKINGSLQQFGIGLQELSARFGKDLTREDGDKMRSELKGSIEALGDAILRITKAVKTAAKLYPDSEAVKNAITEMANTFEILNITLQ